MINNAGVAQLYRMEELDVEGWEQMIDVNLKGTLYGIAEALPVFKKQGSGHIINIISTAGIAIVPQIGFMQVPKMQFAPSARLCARNQKGAGG